MPEPGGKADKTDPDHPKHSDLITRDCLDPFYWYVRCRIYDAGFTLNLVGCQALAGCLREVQTLFSLMQLHNTVFTTQYVCDLLVTSSRIHDQRFMIKDSGFRFMTNVDDHQFICPKCGQVLGTFYEVDGLDFVKMGACLHRSIDALCIHCGRPVYYHFSDKQLMNLVRRVKDDRGKL